MKRQNQRLPFLIWGDLQQYGSPIVRDVQAGWRAIECMYAWVYSTEVAALRRFRQLLDKEFIRSHKDSVFERMDHDLWETFDRSETDPHFRISKGAFEHLVFVLSIIAGSGARDCTVVEYGSTFLSAIDKMDIISSEAARLIPNWQTPSINWVGIEISQYASDMAECFHPGQPKAVIKDRSSFKKGGFSVLYSRFVCSYAFLSTEDFKNYIVNNFDAFVLEDAFVASGVELEVFNHGQRETFFDIELLFSQLERCGFHIYILGNYPDNPAHTARCHVVRFLGVRAGANMEKIRQTSEALGYQFTPDKQRAKSDSILKTLNDSVSEDHWRLIRSAKLNAPIWGPTPVPEATKRNIFDWLYLRKMEMTFYLSGWRIGRIATALLKIKMREALNDPRNRLQ